MWLWAVGWWREELHTSGTACAAAPEEESSSAKPLSALSHSSFCLFFFFFLLLLLFFLWWSANLFLSSYWLPERWDGFSAVHQKRRVSNPEGTRRRDTREKRTLTWKGIIRHEVGKRSSYIMSARGVGAGEIYWIREEVEAKRGLRSPNVLTLETKVSACILPNKFCHSTGLSTCATIYQITCT